MRVKALLTTLLFAAGLAPVDASHDPNADEGFIVGFNPFPKGGDPAIGSPALVPTSGYGFWVSHDSFGRTRSVTEGPAGVPYDIDFYWYGWYNDFEDWGFIGSCTAAGGEERCYPPTSHPDLGAVYADELFVTAAQGSLLDVHIYS